MRKIDSFMIGDSVMVRMKKAEGDGDYSYCTFRCFVRSNFYDDFYRVYLTSKTRHGFVMEDVGNHFIHKASDCFPTDILLIEKSLRK
jgi:hypothetical protein